MAIEQAGEISVGYGVGARAPAWSLPLLDGGELASDSLWGKKTLLFFWGSW
jgi:peroxiredoxin